MIPTPTLDELFDAQPSDADQADQGEDVDRSTFLKAAGAGAAVVALGSWSQTVERMVARRDPTGAKRPPVKLIPTDFGLARQVGAVLHGAGADSADIVDAHVVAVCALHGGGVIVTADGKDIQRLAQAVPSARITTRPSR